MSKEPIRHIQFRKGNVLKEISIEEMTKSFYLENQEYIFCPNSACNANIEYCSGPKLTFFRSKRSIVNGVKIIAQHIEVCRYGIDHDAEFVPRTKYDPSIQVGLSGKHIKDSLMRPFKKHKDPEFGKPNNKKPKSKKKSKSRIGVDGKQIVIKGKISLTQTSGEEESKTRESILFQRNINDIGTRDFGEVRTVFGQIVDINRADNHYSIELSMEGGKKGRVYFGEQFRVLNEVQFSQLDAYMSYYKKMENKNKAVYGSFIGEIVKDKYDVSVYVSMYTGICIDEKYHYDILRAI